MAQTVNVLDPNDKYQQVSTNGSLISVWRRATYDVNLLYDKFYGLLDQVNSLQTKMIELSNTISKVRSMIIKLKTLKTMIHDPDYWQGGTS